MRTDRPDRCLGRLRDVLLIHAVASDGTRFDILLTRVPCIGENISIEDRSYRVVRVDHEPVNSEGVARLGWHAFLDVERLPPEEDVVLLKRRVSPRKRSQK